ncbi:MAG: hypothetical protein WBI17_02440 [Clostridiaceae bacterium]
MNKYLHILSDFFFPNLTCPVCKEYGEGLCVTCRKGFVRYDREALADQEKGLSVYRYQHEVISLIAAYKKKSQFIAVETMANLVLDLYLEDISRFDLVSFAPSSKLSIKKLGFDHGELLAKKIALGAKVKCRGLFHPPSKEQKVLDKEERIQNAKGISLKKIKNKKKSVQGLKILIIDDVYTTGSTLSRCMELITLNGGESKYLTISRL